MEQQEEEGKKQLGAPVLSFRLFGVELRSGGDVDGEAAGKEKEGHVFMDLKKSSSMPNLTSIDPELQAGEAGKGKGYASDDAELSSRQQKRRRRKAQERKKGIPWTEEEHRKFIDGLKHLGKGDWRGISKNFVNTRTATQVASHAQKYFLRQTNPGKKKRRASLFDVGIADFNDDQCVAAKPALTQEIIHTDRGDVPIPIYSDAGGLKLRGNNMQVHELTDYVKGSKLPAEMLLAAMASSVSSLELSIAPPRGAVEAIKVL